MNIFPRSNFFLALAFPLLPCLLLPLSRTPQTSPRTVFFLVSSEALPQFVDYSIPPYSSSPLCCFLQTALSAIAGFLFLACSLLYIAISTFSRLYLF